jgi:hypothetical protein
VSFCVLRWFYRIPVPIPRVVRERRRGRGGAAHGSAFLEDLLELIQRFQLIWRRLQRRRGVRAVRFVARPRRGPRVPRRNHPLLVPGQRRQQRGQRIPPKASNPGESILHKLREHVVVFSVSIILMIVLVIVFRGMAQFCYVYIATILGTRKETEQYLFLIIF